MTKTQKLKKIIRAFRQIPENIDDEPIYN